MLSFLSRTCVPDQSTNQKQIRTPGFPCKSDTGCDVGESCEKPLNFQSFGNDNRYFFLHYQQVLANLLHFVLINRVCVRKCGEDRYCQSNMDCKLGYICGVDDEDSPNGRGR